MPYARWLLAAPLRTGTAVAALALLGLTTFSTSAASPGTAGPVGAASDGPKRGFATPPEVIAGPSVETTSLDEGATGIPEIPELELDPVSLDPFEAPAPTSIPDSVKTLSVDVVVRSDDGHIDVDELAEPLEEARHVAPVAALTAEGIGADAVAHELELLAVDVTTFRPLTPEVTADAPAVWERLVAGDVLVSHDTAEELGLELGGSLTLRTEHGTIPVRVGAFAANGAPPLADVLIPFDVAALLGTNRINGLVLSAGKRSPALAETLDGLVEGTVQLLREPPAAQQEPQPQRQVSGGSGRLESFSYSSHPNGRITIHGDWVARNIGPVEIPGMGTTYCNRIMIPQLQAALRELIARDLYDHLKPDQFAGCFVARHIDWSPTKPLSMHAWGLAIDFNTRENPLGARPGMDPRVVEVFEKWGFQWGGRWSRPDGMHFQLERIVRPS